MNERYASLLEDLSRESNRRVLPREYPSTMVNLSSNDYLGLASSLPLRNTFYETYASIPLSFSASSSRLLTGNSDWYTKLETLIASAFGREACLVLGSGYHANMGILPALTNKNDLIVADKLVHASIIDGIRLASCEFKRFNHNDLSHLENILSASRHKYEQVFVVVESLYSMDGDMADLPGLVALKDKYNLLLYVDEAHAIGTRGTRGLGRAEEQLCIENIDFLVGTFGKALASQGAYLVCDMVVKQYLVNTCRTLIFTTALPPLNLAWTHMVFEKMLAMNEERTRLGLLSSWLSSQLGASSSSHIIPFILGENERAVSVSHDLQQQGFLVLPIRHPTVPRGTARLRFSLNASIEMSDIERLVNIIKVVV